MGKTLAERMRSVLLVVLANSAVWCSIHPRSSTSDIETPGVVKNGKLDLREFEKTQNQIRRLVGYEVEFGILLKISQFQKKLPYHSVSRMPREICQHFGEDSGHMLD